MIGDWQKFFEQYGQAPVTNGIPSATLEHIYQMFKERLKDELVAEGNGPGGETWALLRDRTI